MVPRIIHQIWVGPKEFPSEFAGYQKTWKKHHPDWELKFWTEDNLPGDLTRPEALDRLRTPAERSDILRLEVLLRHGGVYVDTDFECRRSLEPLIADLDFFIADLKPGRTNNAFIGAEPGHPLLERALRECTPREYYGYDKEAAGPLFLDKLVAEQRDTLKVFPPELIYPSTPAEEREAVAIHHHARSWKDAEGFKQAALTAEMRLGKAMKDLDKLQRKHDKAQQRIGELEARLRGEQPRRLARLFGRA